MTTTPIQWYPGHIAKAEKALREQLKRVDVVLEVRDARIPLASHHPLLSRWVGDKAKLLILNREDLIPPAVGQAWRQWFQDQAEQPYFTNAQHGKGIAAVAKAAQATGVHLNQRRRDRGMKPRAVRAVVIGFPNVGKSALINRLLNRRVVESARRPGVTRQLRWVRISEELDLLDTPGVLPAKLEDQGAAYKLAICDDIGDAAYDDQRVAATLVDLLTTLQQRSPELQLSYPLQERYALNPTAQSGEAYLQALAALRYQEDSNRAARKLLTDFRKGFLGPLPLELPPQS
jgi:ribosome biogenesis GTPase A